MPIFCCEHCGEKLYSASEHKHEKEVECGYCGLLFKNPYYKEEQMHKPRLVDPDAYEAAYKDYCEWCGKPTRGEGPHHIFTRGAGGPDIKENLIQLGASNCFCHTKAHDGNITRQQLLERVAKREGMTAEEVEAKIRRARGY